MFLRFYKIVSVNFSRYMRSGFVTKRDAFWNLNSLSMRASISVEKCRWRGLSWVFSSCTVYKLQLLRIKTKPFSHNLIIHWWLWYVYFTTCHTDRLSWTCSSWTLSWGMGGLPGRLLFFTILVWNTFLPIEKCYCMMEDFRCTLDENFDLCQRFCLYKSQNTLLDQNSTFVFEVLTKMLIKELDNNGHWKNYHMVSTTNSIRTLCLII